MLTIVTYLWGDKYTPEYVERLAAGVARHLKQPYRFFCITEREREVNFSGGIERHAIKDPVLIGRSCFVRLRLFDPGWQQNRGITRLVCMDLDSVVVGELDPLFDRAEDFVILQGVHHANPCPYNCSIFMLAAGAHPEIWLDFAKLSSHWDDLSGLIPHHEFPDDQGWLWHKIPKAAAWTPERDGVYAMHKPGWPKGDNLPNNARLVVFPGHRDPSQFTKLNWVADNWHKNYPCTPEAA
jgi:hypothetical protein